MLVGVGGKDTESVVEALSDQIRRLPKTMIDTLTWDRGLLHWHRPLRSPVEPTAAF
jgi:IS30 family transposase